MLITFSGLDGSGKSTLVDYLKQILEEDQHSVAVCHMNYDIGVHSVLRFLVRKTSPNGSRSAISHAPRESAYDGKFRSRAAKLRYHLIWNKALRFAIYPLDVVIFSVYRFYIEKIKREILIMDRYFYDTLVDVTDARQSLRLRLLSALTPKPNLPIYLDTTAEEAFARKNEYSVAYLNRRRDFYQQLIPAIPNLLVLSTTDDLAGTRQNLKRAIRAKLMRAARL